MDRVNYLDNIIEKFLNSGLILSIIFKTGLVKNLIKFVDLMNSRLIKLNFVFRLAT